MAEFEYGIDPGFNSAEKETDPVTSDDNLNWNEQAASEKTGFQEEQGGFQWSKPEDKEPTRGVKIAIDWLELEGALENNSPELHSFLNLINGEVIRVFRGSENSEQTLRHMENSPDFMYIEPISSREQYRWMEEYIEATPESPLKDKLNIAVDGKGAFRRFKDVLVGYPEDRERWFVQRSAKLRVHILDWLKAKNIQPLNLSEWPEPAADHSREVHRRPLREGEETIESGIDLRKEAHELVDLISSRELPTAVAFLEFLRSRRTLKRTRFG